jgi:CheY-like chemotaxis protein
MTIESRTALIVDDNDLNSRLVSLLFKRLGWQCVATDGGEAALAQLRARAFDMVLLDLRMPRMSGEQVCQAIRGELGLATLPVIAYTAHSTLEEHERILASGFDGLLVKPIAFSDLSDACARLGREA